MVPLEPLYCRGAATAAMVRNLCEPFQEASNGATTHSPEGGAPADGRHCVLWTDSRLNVSLISQRAHFTLC